MVDKKSMKRNRSLKYNITMELDQKFELRLSLLLQWNHDKFEPYGRGPEIVY